MGRYDVLCSVFSSSYPLLSDSVKSVNAGVGMILLDLLDCDLGVRQQSSMPGPRTGALGRHYGLVVVSTREPSISSRREATSTR